MDLSRLNMRKVEPEEWQLDAPVVLRRAIELVGEDLCVHDIAESLALHESHFSQLLQPIFTDQICE